MMLQFVISLKHSCNLPSVTPDDSWHDDTASLVMSSYVWKRSCSEILRRFNSETSQQVGKCTHAVIILLRELCVAYRLAELWDDETQT
jgi:hypothetical protein